MPYMNLKRKSLVAFAFLMAATAQGQAQDTDFSVRQALDGYTAEEVRDWVAGFSLADALAAGRPALWFGTNGSQVFPTALIPSRHPASEFQIWEREAVGKISAETALGQLTLEEFVTHPESGMRGVLIVNEGQIVYEAYPGMLQTDSHVTASSSKVFAGLVIDKLIEEGLIEEDAPIGSYVDEFVGNAWENIPVVDVLDMSTGLSPIDGPAYFADPTNISARLLTAEMGDSDESMLDVLLDAEPVAESGSGFTYSSTATQALVLLAEAASGEPWAQIFDTRIWSHVRSDAPVQVHLTPDGIAVAHGFMSMGLRDLARYGMLFTPSQDQVTVAEVVTSEILERTQSAQRTAEWYRNGPSAEKFMERLGDDSVRGAGRQWDAIWEDGDFFKSGLNTQGIYVSPDRDLVIVYFAIDGTQQFQRYLRPLATSGLFGE
jgi:CubicO group peptidase (beta-lactamase class C family)